MEQLWAPWRMEYIEQIGKEEKACIFCSKSAQNLDDENFVLHRGRTVFILLNTFPYTNGHLLVAPYRHLADLAELSAEEAKEFFSAAALAVSALRQALSPEGFNLGLNLGRAAGAGIVDHLHLHIVPRWSGDTNFMAVCGGVKVIPEALPDTLKKLRLAVAALRSTPEGGEREDA